MRKFISYYSSAGETPRFGVTPIEHIRFDLHSRDEITKILRGLQEVYLDEELRSRIAEVLTQMIPAGVSRDKGREGMSLWSIFVLGMLRLGCSWDYDKLKNCFDNHMQIRQMAGVDLFCDLNKVVSLQSVHDNVSLFTNEISDTISEMIIKFGHGKLFPNTKGLHTRCDSFVFLSNVHFPTDFNLLLDSVRKCINICAHSAEKSDLSGWREHCSMWNKIRGEYNTLSKMRYSNSKNEDRKEKRKQEIHNKIRHYLDMAANYMLKAEAYQHQFGSKVPELDRYLDYGKIFIDQITRRVFEDETIPQEEKIYSVFEPYTEWICKGKAGVRQELGVKVCIVEDQFGFIIDHRVMNKEQDKDIAFTMADSCKKSFPNIASMSFDKGYYSKRDENGKNNQTRIEDELNVSAYIPVKGRRNKVDQERETSSEFAAARKQHPAVESAINALESHGLDRCPDRGEENYNRYVSMAITASNIHRLGALLLAKDLKKQQRKTA